MEEYIHKNKIGGNTMNIRRQILFICTICFILCGVQNVQAQEPSQYKTYEGFEYSYSSSKDCIYIMKYTGTAAYVTVPAYIDGKEVRYLCDAFKNNTTIKKVELPNTLVDIGRFTECTALEEIVIPNKVKKISTYAFYGCKSLKNVQFSNGLLDIGNNSFTGCNSLKEVVIPNTVTSLGAATFSNCTTLQKVVLSKNIDSIGSRVFYNCKKLKTIPLPKKVYIIKEEAFAGCKSLQKIKFPSAMAYIEAYAFRGCGLKQIVLPKNMLSIEEGAFSDCKKLKKIVIKSKGIETWRGYNENKAEEDQEEESLKDLVFYNIHKKAVFDVPNSCIKKYKEWLIETGCFKKTMKIK